MNIGIMQGRLSPPVNRRIQAFPVDNWENEFEQASKIGFSCIEWVFDTIPKNPILDKTELKKIYTLSNDFDISINSVCSDYFMEKKLFNVSEVELDSNLDILKKLIENCNQLGISFLEIPLVDSSSIQNKLFENEFKINLEKILPFAEKHNVVLTLETDLLPIRFNSLLSYFDSHFVGANYDIGNSTSLDYDISLEFEIMEKWFKNIHIKDRKKHGPTISLGEGDANFELFFSLLSNTNYSNDLIIQGSREDLENSSITPETTCKKYYNFVKNFIKN